MHALQPPKIDIHTHILPENLPDLESRFGYPGWLRLEHVSPNCCRMFVAGEFFRQVRANCWNLQVRLKECDEHGVRLQVLSTVPVMFSYWAKPEHTLELSKIVNDHLCEVVQKHPKRFVALGTVPLQAPELAIREMERCKKELGFPGLQIGSHVNGWNLDEAELFPFFEAAQELNMALFVHPWDMLGKEAMPKYWLPWLVGMPAETSRAICSMIFGGVFERFPRLRVAFAHGGGSFPATIGRIEHGFKVRPDLCAVNNAVSPRRYLGKFYVDSLVHDEKMLRYLIELLGGDKVALGSDYPFPLGEAEPGALIESLRDLSPEIKERLLWKNALDWLGLDAGRLAITSGNHAGSTTALNSN